MPAHTEQTSNQSGMRFTTGDLSGSSREREGQLHKSDEGQMFLEGGVERGKFGRLTLPI